MSAYSKNSTSGTIYWYKINKAYFHRDNDMPAVEYDDGTKEWWVHNQLHRANDMPAVEWNDGGKEYWMNGKRHRDGNLPAVEYPDGKSLWFIDGQRVPDPQQSAA